MLKTLLVVIDKCRFSRHMLVVEKTFDPGWFYYTTSKTNTSEFRLRQIEASI